jgi:ABC-2 type transport system permease protein
MGKLLLRLVALFKTLFIKQGVDYDKMMAIVETKLVMDQRRTIVQFRQNRLQNENSNRMQIALLVYGLMGVFVGIVVFVLPSVLIAMTVVNTYIMGMMAMTLITDFSTVLLDTTDNQVLLPKPVDGKTLFMARLIHILIYIAQFTLVLSLIPVVCLIIKYSPIVGLLSIFSIVLIVLTAVFLSYLLYLLIITFSSERKVKDIITYLQIFAIMFFTLGVQIIPRMFNLAAIEAGFHLSTATYFLPPVWMAVVIDGIHAHTFQSLHAGMLALAIVFPLLSLWLMNKYLAPAFARKLAAISVDGSPGKATDKAKRESKPLSTFFSSFTCRSSLERGAFQFTWKVTGRDKTFKLKFYPSLGYILVYVFIFVFQQNGSLKHSMATLHESNSFLWFIYTPILVASSSITIISFSDNFQSAWIYYASPLQRPGEVLSGAVKALFVKFLLPVFTIMFIACLFIWGPAIIDDFLFGLISNYLSCFILALAADHTLPFSKQPTTEQGTGNFLLMMLQLVLVAALVCIHYLIIRFGFQWLLWMLTPLLLWLAIIATRKIQKLQWNKIAVS